MLDDDRAEEFGGDVGDMEGLNLALALNERGQACFCGGSLE